MCCILSFWCWFILITTENWSYCTFCGTSSHRFIQWSSIHSCCKSSGIWMPLIFLHIVISVYTSKHCWSILSHIWCTITSSSDIRFVFYCSDLAFKTCPREDAGSIYLFFGEFILLMICIPQTMIDCFYISDTIVPSCNLPKWIWWRRDEFCSLLQTFRKLLHGNASPISRKSPGMMVNFLYTFCDFLTSST